MCCVKLEIFCPCLAELGGEIDMVQESCEAPFFHWSDHHVAVSSNNFVKGGQSWSVINNVWLA